MVPTGTLTQSYNWDSGTPAFVQPGALLFTFLSPQIAVLLVKPELIHSMAILPLFGESISACLLAFPPDGKTLVLISLRSPGSFVRII